MHVYITCIYSTHRNDHDHHPKCAYTLVHNIKRTTTSLEFILKLMRNVTL